MPALLHLLTGAAGIACLVRSVPLPGRGRWHRDAEAARRGRAVRIVVLDAVAHFLERLPALRRHSDDAGLVRRFALAPGAWPWRLAGGTTAAPDGDAATVARVAALRVCLAAAGALVGALGLVLGGPALLPIAVLLTVAALGTVDLAIAGAAREAERRIVDAVPDLLDTLATGFEAGLVLEQALHLAAVAVEPPLAAILDRVLAAIRAGEPPAAAFSREAERCGVDALGYAARVVERGRRLGEPVAGALLAAAATARAEAAAATAARSARRSSLASLVVAAVIAPACVVAVITVVIAGVLAAGHSAPGG